MIRTTVCHIMIHYVYPCATFRWDRDPISYKMVRENKKDEAF